jgi:hypothetical protein
VRAASAQPRISGVLSVGPAPGGRRGDMSQTRRLKSDPASLASPESRKLAAQGVGGTQSRFANTEKEFTPLPPRSYPPPLNPGLAPGAVDSI